MSEDPIAVLERELVDAAHRRASVGPEGRRRLNVGALAVAALVAVTLAVAGGALILLAGHKRPAATTATDRSRQQLIDILAVLRRPQTKTDLDPQLLSRLSRNPLLSLRGAPDRPLVRLATVTSWGERVFLVPMKPLTASAISSWRRRHPALVGRPPAQFLAQRTAGETLGVFTSGPGSGGGSCCETAASIQAGGEGPGIEGFFGPVYSSGYARLISVVPDGVAKVVFILPRQGGPIAPGAAVYKHTLTVAAHVHGNVGAVQVARQCCGGPIPTIWYGTTGQVIKRFGNTSAANRVIPFPKPGPQTPLSRAAEQNASTPNRVWVTPRAGGPRTQFKVHFHVLLTGVNYHYTFTGTPCPQLRFVQGAADGGSVGGGLNGVRGQVWNDSLSPDGGKALCPGIYHVSVTVDSLGIGRPLKHPARPFGAATFIVKP